MKLRPVTRAFVRTLVLGCVLLACMGVGQASAASGTVTVPNVRTNAMSVGIAFTTSGGDVASSQLERRSAPLAADACGSYSAWAAVSGSNPASPYSDATIADGLCYEYRLRITDTMAATTYATDANTVRVDRTAPSGTITPLTGMGVGVVSVGGTGADSGTGVASMSLSYSGAASGTPCPAMPTSPWTCGVDTSAMPDGMYTLQLLVTDAAGNVSSPITTVTVVDKTAPVATFGSFTELTGSQYMYSSGSTMYFNGNQAGSFLMSVNATDAGSGILNASFPVLASGWTPGTATLDTSAPYEHTYAFSVGAATVGGRNVAVRDNANNLRNVAFTLTVDSTTPTGGSITPGATGSVAFVASADAGVGVGSVQLQRRTATDTSGTCGTYGAWSNVGPVNPTSPYQDMSIPAATCAQYRVTTTDQVGNLRTVTSTAVARAPVTDVVPPVVAFGSFTELVGSAYTHPVGTTMWVNPAQSASFRVAATATDAGTGVNRVSFPMLGTGWSPASPSDDAGSPYEVTYAFVPGPSAPGLQTLTAFDNASNSATATFTVSPDTGAPTGGSITATYGASGVNVTHAAGADAASGLATVAIQRRSAPLTAGTCVSYGSWIQVGATNPASPYLDAAVSVGNCYEYRLVQTDNVGNEAIVGGNVIQAVAAAVGVQMTGPTSVVEGGATSSFTLVLSRQPTANVVVTLSGDAQLTTDGGPRTFTTSNWMVPQTVVVTAIDDATAESSPHAGSITSTVTSGDTAFNALVVAPVSLDITDNDTAGVQVTLTVGLAVTEGGPTPAMFTVALTSQPTAPVTIDFTPDAQVTTDLAARTFTAANWNVPVTVTVSAVDDSVDEASAHVGRIDLAVGSADPLYAAVSLPGLNVGVFDDDTAGVTVTPSGAGNAVSEAGTTDDTFDVVLDSEPTADVTVSFAADGQTTVVPAVVTFTAANWYVPQTVTVTAVDDSFAETSTHASRIPASVTSSDPTYQGLMVADIEFDVTDDDVAGLVTTPITLAVAEGGTSDTLAVRLAAEPAADVTVYLNGDAQVAAWPVSLTFTAADWSVPQVVTVQAVDDAVDEASQHAGVINFGFASSDLTYAGTAVPGVAVDVADNDTAAVDVAPTNLVATEGGAGDTFTVQLLTQPTSNVTIAVAGDSQVAVSTPTVVFTASDWNVPQVVSVDAVDDIVDEADPHVGMVTLAASSLDPNYATSVLPTVSVDVTDDDLPIPPDPSPPTGGSIIVPNMITNATSVPINFTVGTDAISGIDGWRVQRRVAIYGGGGCTVFSSWTDVGGPSPASPLLDTYAAQQCVAYRLVVTDRAGNHATYANETVLRIDRGNPFGSIDEAGPGVTRFDGMASDLGSATVSVDVRVSGPVSIEACSNLRVTGGLWNCTFDDSTIVNGTYTITATMRDDAGNVMTASQPWERFVRPADLPTQPVTPPRAVTENTPVAPRDTTLPRLKGVTLAPVSFESTAELAWTASDDSGEEPVVQVERRATKARGTWGRWTTVARDAASPFEFSTGVRGSTTCLRILVSDAAGNRTSSPERCTTVPLDDRGLAVTRNWTRGASEAAFAGTATIAPRWSAATMSTRVSGYSTLKLVAATCRTCGSVRVYIGNRLATTVSLRTRRANPRAVITLRVPARAKGGVVALRSVRGSGAVAIDGLVVHRT